MLSLEEKILKSFKEKMGDEVQNLDLIVSLNYSDGNCNDCEIIEKKDNGKVWFVEYDETGEIEDTLEI